MGRVEVGLQTELSACLHCCFILDMLRNWHGGKMGQMDVQPGFWYEIQMSSFLSPFLVVPRVMF